MSDTPIADMVEQMLSGGMSADMVVLAVRTAERMTTMNTSGSGSVDQVAERRREWDRRRKAAKRASVSGGQPADTTKSAYKKESTDSVDSYKKESKEVFVLTPVESPVDKPKRKTGKVLPPDWAPNEKHFDLAKSLGFDRNVVIDLAARMRAWADAEGHRAVARKSNWDQAFSGWLRRDVEKRRPQNQGRQSFMGAARAAMANGGFDGK